MTTVKKKYQVFISSTFIDLIKEREAITKAAIDMGFIPAGMESFPASSSEQLRYIQKVIDDCDYYILIIGSRYGSTDEQGISYTENEYNYAVKSGKTILTFIHANPSIFPQSVADRDHALAEKLEKFRREAETGRIVKHWENAEQLALYAMTALHHAKEDFPGIGWVRGDFSVHDNTPAARSEEVANLWRIQHEVTDLSRKLASCNVAIENLFTIHAKPATLAEILRWKEGAAFNYSNINTVLGSSRTIYYMEKDFILPPFYGNSSVTVLIKEGVNVFKVGDSGHNTILYFEGFRWEGPGSYYQVAMTQDPKTVEEAVEAPKSE